MLSAEEDDEALELSDAGALVLDEESPDFDEESDEEDSEDDELDDELPEPPVFELPLRA